MGRFLRYAALACLVGFPLVFTPPPPSLAQDRSATKADRIAEADRLEMKARSLFAQRDYDGAEERILRALDLKQRALGRKHPDLASPLSLLAEIIANRSGRNRGRIDSAPVFELFLRAATMLESADGPGYESQLISVYTRLALYADIIDPRIAADVHLKTFRLLQKNRPPGDSSLIKALTGAVEFLARRGGFWGTAERRAALAEAAERELIRAEGELDPESLAYANVLRVVGKALRCTGGDPDRTLELLEQALAIRKALLAPDDLLIAESHAELARTYKARGDAAACRRELAAAQEIWRAKGMTTYPIDPKILEDKNPALSRAFEWIRGLGKLLRQLEAYDAACSGSGADSPAAIAAGRRCLESTVSGMLGGEVAFVDRISKEILAGSHTKNGPGSIDHADTLLTVARASIFLGRPEEAVEHLEDALKIRRSKAGKSDPLTADAHAALAYALCSLMRYEEAVENYEAAIRIREGRKGPRDIDCVRLRVNLATVQKFRRDYDGAHETLDVLFEHMRTGAELRRALEPLAKDPVAGRVFSLLAHICRWLGRGGDEIWLCREAPGIYQRVSWDDHEFALLAGNYGEALRLAREVQKTPAATETQRKFFILYQRMQRAEALLAVGADEEALAELLVLTEQVIEYDAGESRGADNSQFLMAAPSMTLLAEALFRRGLVEESLAIGAQALHYHLGGPGVLLIGPSSGTLHPLSESHVWDWSSLAGGRSLRNETLAPEVYARALLTTGEPDRAIRVLEDTVTELDQRFPPDHPRIAEALVVLARAMLCAGERDEAREIAKTALKNLRKAWGKDHPALVDALLLSADLDLLDGQYSPAEKGYKQVLAIAGKSLFDTHLAYPMAYSGMAVSRALDGRAESGLEPMRKALAHVGDRARALFPGATNRERIGLMGAVHWALGNWLLVSGEAGVPGYEEVLRYKGLLGRAMAIDQRLYRESEGRAREVFDELRKAERLLARLAYQAPRRGWSRLSWRRRVAEATARCAKLTKELRKTYSSYGPGITRLDLGGKAVRAALEKGEALMDIYLAGGNYTAWVSSAKGETTRVDLGPAEELEPLMQDFREKVREVDSTEDEQYLERGRKLRERLWEPLAAALPPETTTVYLVPDAAVCATPLRALPGSSEGAVLDDEIRLILLSAAQDLVPMKPRPRAGRGLVVVGNVNFEATDRPQLPGVTGLEPLHRRVPGGRSFPALPATATEAGYVQSALKTAGPVTYLTEERATEHALREAVAGCRILHMATHGFVRESLGTSLRLSAGEEFRLRPGLEIHAQCFDPLLLSGLALSGANKRLIENDDDGILTALEAMGLPLSGVKLVVLSACETAQGIEAAGEGMIGLVRGFTLAGGECVVASLWPVADEATLELMRCFYGHLLGEERLAPADALRAAARDLRKHPRHKAPRHWSAFVSFGR